jgi:hypothetical protein
MNHLLEATKTPISLIPEALLLEAAWSEGMTLDQLEPTRAGNVQMVADSELAGRVIGGAVGRWRERAPSWRRLDFTMQHREQSEWCWAATSVSVSAYYDPQTTWTQCAMVNAEKGLTTCCEDGSSKLCNEPNRLDGPLTRAGVLDHKQGGSVGSDEIEREIDAGRPLAWRIGWSGGGGHFALIEAYQSGGAEWVAVDDPWLGPSDLPLSTLTEGTYHAPNRWTHTYFTRPPASDSSGAREDPFRQENVGAIPS